MKNSNKVFKKPNRYKLWLNIYPDMAFTRCPICEKTQTKIQKKPLVIRIEDADFKILMNINFSIRYCPYCELIIVKEKDLLAHISSELQREIKSEHVFIFGNMDRTDWLGFNNQKIDEKLFFDYIYPFKDVLNFKIQPAG